MKKKRQTMLVCMLLCLCCLLGGCRESALQTVYASACAMAESGETCEVGYDGSRYLEAQVTDELTEFLDPSYWEETTPVDDGVECHAIRLPFGKLTFYEGNSLCITMAQTNEQIWYVSDADIYEQVEDYIVRNGLLVVPELLEYAAVCK